MDRSAPTWHRTFLLRRFLPLLAVGLLASGPAQAQTSPSPETPDSVLVQVDELRGDGRFQKAISRLKTLRREYGDDVEILWRLSLTEVDLAKTLEEKDERKPHYRTALAFADTALTVDSTSAHAHLAKAVAEGRIALDAGTRERVQRSRAVKTHADRAIELDDTLPGAYHTRARWNREASDLNFFERAIVKTVYGGLPESSFEQAVRDFKRAIELENVRFHHLELAKTYLKMDRTAEARSELQTVLELPAREPFDQQYKTEAQTLLEELE
ncbi:hypothetical protein BSZ35_16895 [Salinibacter sp. 10B]|uniref:tetratricopeptide repeat protein n=1 Tax=Salinibacter sp. 10B TaxID=1923971 RepID=UPI000D2D40DA|nr:hypothetical protein [Salinibacter sp. 10B]PQJ36055.1 hypothetical protein BSZ35_16895 [Salinibacter sp. 10B]